jgi:hypothetical protein
MFTTKKLTADPKENVNRALVLLKKNNNALLLYAALELRLALERAIHNQLSLSIATTLNNKGGNDPKKKKLIINCIDSESDNDFNIFYRDPITKEKLFWGTYKNIPESKLKYIEGRLGNLLHMKRGISLGVEDDYWYLETRTFLMETASYLKERLNNSLSYFAYKDVPYFELEII